MTTKYAAVVRMGLCAFCFAAVAMGAVLFAGMAAAQESPSAPVAPAQPAAPDILGGREADPGAWPWQVALVSSFQSNAYLGQFCGGTLIDDDWVLTAAHCTDGTEASFIDVLVGAHTLSSSGTRIRAAEIVQHADFDPTLLDNDLALIRLSSPVTYTPISLYQAVPGATEWDYMRATVIGWGIKNITWWSYDYADALREVSLPLVSKAQCQRNQYYNTITDNMICAGYETLSKGACYGDSGGPLMVQQPDASWMQIGIVSWGPSGCLATGEYDVYTRISRYSDWIATCMADPDAMACRGGDGYEPDNSAATAQQLAAPIVNQMHTFHESGDQDWVRFDVEAGKEYLFLTARITNTVAPLTTILWLFEADGHTPITYTEGVSWWDPLFGYVALGATQLVWEADRTGPVYASVELLPNLYEQEYGAQTRYWLTVGEYTKFFLPVIAAPPPTPASPLCTDLFGNTVLCPTPVPVAPIIVTPAPAVPATPIPVSTP